MRLDLLLQTNTQFDLIFIDADKISYNDYYDRSIKLLRPGGVILLDNMFFGGAVVDPVDNLPATRAIRALNKRLQHEPGIEVCTLPIGDGLSLVRKVVG